MANKVILNRASASSLCILPRDFLSRMDVILNVEVLAPLIKFHGMRPSIHCIRNEVRSYFHCARPMGMPAVKRAFAAIIRMHVLYLCERSYEVSGTWTTVEAMSCTHRAGHSEGWSRFSPDRLNVAITPGNEQFKNSGQQQTSLYLPIRVLWMHSYGRQIFSNRSTTQNAQELRASILFQIAKLLPKPPKARPSLTRPGLIRRA